MENYPLRPQNRGIWQGKDENYETAWGREKRGVVLKQTHTHISFKIYTENVEFNEFHLRRGIFIKDLGLELV